MPIKILNSRDMPPKPLHAFVYGPLRTGKTQFASTFPKPVFLSIGTEGGDTTLQFVAQDTQIISIRSQKDMQEAIEYIRLYGSKFGWQTIVVDSITYYSDLVVQELTQNGTKPMRQPDWGMLDLHLQKWLLPTLRLMPQHVVWIAIEQAQKGKDGEIRGIEPMLYGKSASKLPGACDLILHSEVAQVRVEGKLVPSYIMRTIPYDGATAGGRFGTAFASGQIPAHFAFIAQAIGKYIGVSGAPVVAPVTAPAESEEGGESGDASAAS
jgi:hypothetical protein